MPYYSYLNKYVFELQSHLRIELERKGINRNLNPTIYSETISESLTGKLIFQTKKTDKDLLFPFLFFLCEKYNGMQSLFEYIEDFIFINRNELCWEDIVMTPSGATRIYTNTRFALNQLRDLGLVKRINENGKTDLEPTVLGYLLCHLIAPNYNETKSGSKLKYNYENLELNLRKIKDMELINENFMEFEYKYPKLFLMYNENLFEVLNAFKLLFIENSVFNETGIHIPDKLLKDSLYKKLISLLK